MNDAVTPREKAKECIAEFEKHMSDINHVIIAMTDTINTLPIVLLPTKVKGAGNALLITLRIDEGKYCPLGYVINNKAILSSLEYIDMAMPGTLVPQSEVAGIKNFDAGELWE